MPAHPHRGELRTYIKGVGGQKDGNHKEDDHRWKFRDMQMDLKAPPIPMQAPALEARTERSLTKPSGTTLWVIRENAWNHLPCGAKGVCEAGGGAAETDMSCKPEEARPGPPESGKLTAGRGALLPACVVLLALLVPAPARAGEVKRPAESIYQLPAHDFLHSADSLLPESLLATTIAPHTPIDDQVQWPGDVSIGLLDQRLAVAFIDPDNRQLKLWYDDGRGGGLAGDGRAGGAEVRILATLPYTPASAVSLTTLDGILGVAFSAGGGQPLFLWRDDGGGGGVPGDGVANGSETRVIGNDFEAGGEIVTLDERCTILWRSFTSGLQIWHDDGRAGGLADDGMVNGMEIRTPALPFSALIGNAETFTVVDGQLAVAYWAPFTNSFSNLMLWVDDGMGPGSANDLTVNGNEIRLIGLFPNITDWWTSMTVLEGLLAITFHRLGTEQDLMLWYDDGGSPRGNFRGDTEEFRRLATVGNTGAFSGITEIAGMMAVHYQITGWPQMRLWVDDGNDGAVSGDYTDNGGTVGLLDGPENRVADQAVNGGGFFASSTTFDPAPQDPTICEHIAIAHYGFCNTCGFPNDLALNLTTVNILAAQGLFVHDTGNNYLHDPIAVDPDIHLTLRWSDLGADQGEVFLSGDVTGPYTGTWVPLEENLGPAWSDFMTIPVTLTGGDGDKFVMMEFRSGICSGNTATRSILLDTHLLPDPANLRVGLDALLNTLLSWDPAADPALVGYNVYRASNANVPFPGSPPGGWERINTIPLEPDRTTYTDHAGDLGGSSPVKNPRCRQARAFRPISALRNLPVAVLQPRFRALISSDRWRTSSTPIWTPPPACITRATWRTRWPSRTCPAHWAPWWTRSPTIPWLSTRWARLPRPWSM